MSTHYSSSSSRAPNYYSTMIRGIRYIHDASGTTRRDEKKHAMTPLVNSMRLPLSFY